MLKILNALSQLSLSEITSRHTTREEEYDIRDLISGQLNWKLVDQFLNLQNT